MKQKQKPEFKLYQRVTSDENGIKDGIIVRVYRGDTKRMKKSGSWGKGYCYKVIDLKNNAPWNGIWPEFLEAKA
jgi:hypothetical protein